MTNYGGKSEQVGTATPPSGEIAPLPDFNPQHAYRRSYAALWNRSQEEYLCCQMWSIGGCRQHLTFRL
jgi:hypothetical protein